MNVALCALQLMDFDPEGRGHIETTFFSQLVDPDQGSEPH